jgi:tripartite-type tricarboxylate transporter receptor subunit TctC
MSKRVVVEIRQDLHKELRKLAVLNDLKIYMLANAMLEDYLADEEHVKALLKRLKI